MRVAPEDLEWWLALAPTLRWTFAKSMPETPHSYVVRGRALDEAAFDRAVKVIRTFGEPGKFYSRTNIYLTSDDTKWWTMGAPLEETIIINQAATDQVYGTQDAPRTKVEDTFTVYDSIATEYDDRYVTADDLAENEWIRKLIAGYFPGRAPSTLDVGCGTGLLLDLGVVSKKLYVGIDPSQGMLNELVRKHPEIKADAVIAGTASDVLPALLVSRRKFDLVAAVFSALYLTPADWEAMAQLTQDIAIFFFPERGYLPDYWVGEERAEMLARIETVRPFVNEFARRHQCILRTLGHYTVVILQKF